MNTLLPIVPEETELTEFLESGKAFQLHPEVLQAWQAMKNGAASQAVALQLVSAFRSVERQKAIIAAKKRRGVPDVEIYRVNAPPDYSEHHSGRAIDLATEGYPPLEEVFEESPAFGWLMKNARSLGFQLSYPRGNRYGIAYEPWHWFYRGRS